MGFQDRRLLGHHIPQCAASVLAYSRDEQTRLQAVVYKVLQMIIKDEFNPDLPRVEHLRQLVGIPDFPEADMPAGKDELFYESSEGSQDADVDGSATRASS